MRAVARIVTDCSSNRLCSLARWTLRLAMRSALFCSFSSLSCWRWANCLFSMSDRRFCAAVVLGACESAPRTAPNSLRSRPLSRRTGGAGFEVEAVSRCRLGASSSSRGRLAFCSDIEDWRLLLLGEAGARSSSGSTTAEAIGPSMFEYVHVMAAAPLVDNLDV